MVFIKSMQTGCEFIFVAVRSTTCIAPIEVNSHMTLPSIFINWSPDFSDFHSFPNLQARLKLNRNWNYRHLRYSVISSLCSLLFLYCIPLGIFAFLSMQLHNIIGYYALSSRFFRFPCMTNGSRYICMTQILFLKIVDSLSECIRVQLSAVYVFIWKCFLACSEKECCIREESSKISSKTNKASML